MNNRQFADILKIAQIEKAEVTIYPESGEMIIPTTVHDYTMNPVDDTTFNYIRGKMVNFFVNQTDYSTGEETKLDCYNEENDRYICLTYTTVTPFKKVTYIITAIAPLDD